MNIEPIALLAIAVVLVVVVAAAWALLLRRRGGSSAGAATSGGRPECEELRIGAARARGECEDAQRAAAEARPAGTGSTLESARIERARLERLVEELSSAADATPSTGEAAKVSESDLGLRRDALAALQSRYDADRAAAGDAVDAATLRDLAQRFAADSAEVMSDAGLVRLREENAEHRQARLQKAQMDLTAARAAEEAASVAAEVCARADRLQRAYEECIEKAA